MNDSYMASPPTDGTLCQWYACPATNVVKIPDSLSWEESGSIQPLSIAIQVGRRAGLRAHQNVVVFGCGPLGLLCMAVAKAYGAKNIIAIDISTKRLEFAKSYAATHTFLPSRKPQDKDVMEWNAELAAQVLQDVGVQSGVDVAIEASGAEPCMQLAIAMLRTGGTCKHTGVSTCSELKGRPTSRNGCSACIIPYTSSRNEGARSQGDVEIYHTVFRRRHRPTRSRFGESEAPRDQDISTRRVRNGFQGSESGRRDQDRDHESAIGRILVS